MLKKELSFILKKPLLLFFSIFILISCAHQVHEIYTSSANKEVLDVELSQYTFRTDYLLQEHFEKHGKKMGFKKADEYVLAANKVIASKDALIKEEKEDGDYVYYIENTNEIVFLSKNGYIRSYFNPSNGKKYFDKQ